MNKSTLILASAKDAFIENGFANTSMDDIARRAGTTKRTVYNHFVAKERLLEAVIDHAIELFEAAVPPLPVHAGDAALTGFCATVLQLVTWRGAIGLQRLLIAEGLSFPDLARRLSTRSAAAICGPLAAWLQARGGDAAQAQALALQAIDMLTSKARLDRLVGMRPAYAALPGKNRLDAWDRAAVEAALRQLGGRA